MRLVTLDVISTRQHNGRGYSDWDKSVSGAVELNADALQIDGSTPGRRVTKVRCYDIEYLVRGGSEKVCKICG